MKLRPSHYALAIWLALFAFYGLVQLISMIGG